MGYKQLINPNLNTTDYAGWCLRFVGNAFGTKNRPHPHAWDAWSKAKHRHSGNPPDAMVPVFYEWHGTIDGKHQNWGDVAIWVPGRGVFGTPPRGSGKSHRWDSNIHARAAWLGGSAKYVGWTEDLNGYRLVEQSQGDGTPTEKDIQDYFAVYVGKPPTKSQLDHYKQTYWRKLVDDAFGVYKQEKMEGLKLAQVREKALTKQLADQTAKVQGLERALEGELEAKDRRVSTLEQQLKTQTANSKKKQGFLQDEILSLSDEIEVLREQLARSGGGEVEVTKWNTLKALLRELLGIKK